MEGWKMGHRAQPLLSLEFCPDLIFWHCNWGFPCTPSRSPYHCPKTWLLKLSLVWLSCLPGSGAARPALFSLMVVPGLALFSQFLPFPFTQMSNKRSNSFRQAILQGNRRLCSKALLEETGLSLSQRLIRHVAYETLPREIDRKWYYDSYTCCPPPWFMITITIVEASTLSGSLPTLPKPRLGHSQGVETGQGQTWSWCRFGCLLGCV